jgi:hypothetical protein
MKMMQGEFCFACSNRSRTREAPTPTNISTKSEPEIEKNGTPASPRRRARAASCRCPAARRAARPSGCAPERLELLRVLQELLDLVELLDRLVHPGDVAEGDLRRVDRHRFARDLPKDMTFEPPPCIWLMMNSQNSRKITNGRM